MDSRTTFMEEKNEMNIIETGVIEVEVTANWGTGKAIQMNNDAEPIKNIQGIGTPLKEDCPRE